MCVGVAASERAWYHLGAIFFRSYVNHPADVLTRTVFPRSLSSYAAWMVKFSPFSHVPHFSESRSGPDRHCVGAYHARVVVSEVS